MNTERLADIAALGVAASVAVALGGLAWRLAGDPGGVDAPVTPAVAAPPLDLAPIARLAPFGRAVTPSLAAAGAPAAATSASLELKGIVVARPRSASAALIADAGAPPRAFAIGATLPGGAVIDSIEYDLVLLRFGDRLETLAFPARGGSATAVATAVTASAATAAPPPPPPPQASRAADIEALRALIPPTSLDSDPADPAAMMEAVRDRVSNNPRALLDSLGAVPAKGGYRVGASAAPAMLAAGLQPGDVIERINGQPVGDVESDRALFERVVASGRARVDVRRGDTRVSLSFPLR